MCCGLFSPVAQINNNGDSIERGLLLNLEPRNAKLALGALGRPLPPKDRMVTERGRSAKTLR